MKSRLLEFNDGVMIEVGDPQGPRAEMSARDVETTMEVKRMVPIARIDT